MMGFVSWGLVQVFRLVARLVRGACSSHTSYSPSSIVFLPPSPSQAKRFCSRLGPLARPLTLYVCSPTAHQAKWATHWPKRQPLPVPRSPWYLGLWHSPPLMLYAASMYVAPARWLPPSCSRPHRPISE